MKIIVNEKNREKIAEAIKKAEGRATARCISYDHIVKTIARIERHLSIPKKHMTGITVSVDYWAQTFPTAYKSACHFHAPESTHFCMTRTASGWAVTDIYRYFTQSPSKAVSLTLTDAARQALIESRETFEI